MEIDINTKFITLIGTPLSQSFAARMQNAGYRAAGLNMCYFYCEADERHLGEIVNGIRYMPAFAGCAVTKPNKVAVLNYLDRLDPLCEKMGACNTVVKEADGSLVGYNTDGIGFYLSLVKEGGMDPVGKTFFCVGAGGAGRAICSVLAYHGAEKIYISDIFEQSSRQFAEDINRNFADIAEFVPYGEYRGIEDSHMVINASGVGMGKSVGESPIPQNVIRPDHICFDACYNPAETQFLLEAKEKGCRTLNGLGMSLYQGVAQIELWTGREAPVEAMRQELMTIIAEKEQAGV